MTCHVWTTLSTLASLQAVEHYETASQLGHSKSVYNLAMLHMLGQHPLTKDTDLALQLLEKAATMGLPQVC